MAIQYRHDKIGRLTAWLFVDGWTHWRRISLQAASDLEFWDGVEAVWL